MTGSPSAAILVREVMMLGCCTFEVERAAFAADFADLRQLHGLDLDGVEDVGQLVLARLHLLLMIDYVVNAKVRKFQAFLLDCFILQCLQRAQLSEDFLVLTESCELLLSLLVHLDFLRRRHATALVMRDVPNAQHCRREKRLVLACMPKLVNLLIVELLKDVQVLIFFEPLLIKSDQAAVHVREDNFSRLSPVLRRRQNRGRTASEFLLDYLASVDVARGLVR